MLACWIWFLLSALGQFEDRTFARAVSFRAAHYREPGGLTGSRQLKEVKQEVPERVRAQSHRLNTCDGRIGVRASTEGRHPH